MDSNHLFLDLSDRGVKRRQRAAAGDQRSEAELPRVGTLGTSSPLCNRAGSVTQHLAAVAAALPALAWGCAVTARLQPRVAPTSTQTSPANRRRAGSTRWAHWPAVNPGVVFRGALAVRSAAGGAQPGCRAGLSWHGSCCAARLAGGISAILLHTSSSKGCAPRRSES